MKKILSFLLATAMLFSALNIAVQAEEPVGLPIMDTFDSEPLEGWTFDGDGGTQTVADSRLTLTKNGTDAEYSAQREIDKNGVDGTYYMETKFQARVTRSGFNIYLLNRSGETVIPVLIHSAGRDQKPGSGNDGRIIMNAYDTEKEADVELDLAEFTKDQEHVLGIKMDTQQKKYWAYLDGNLLCSAEGLSMPQQTPEKEYKISQVKFVLANNCKSGDALVLDTFSLTQWTQIDEQLNQAKEALVATNLTQEDPMAVTEDLTLPESGLNGTKISWTSDRTDLIGNDGKINLANILSLSQSTAVTMTATISLDGKSVTKSFVFYVQKYRMEQVFADVFQPEADIPDGWTGNGTNAKQEMTSMGRLRVTATGDKNAEYTVTRELGNALTGVYQIDMTVNTNPHNDSVWFGVNDSTGSELVRGRIHASGISTNAAGNKGRVLVNHFDAGQSKMTEVVAAELTKGTDHILSIRIDTTQKKFWMMLDGATIMPSGVETDGLYYANPEQERENNNLQTFYIQLSKTRTNDYVELAKFSLKKCIPLEAQDVDALLLEAKNALKISDLTQDDPSNLQHDLTLPATGQNETAITWLSNNQNLISDQGVLNQEEVAKLTKAVQVVMTATFSLDGKTAQQEYYFTINPPSTPGPVGLPIMDTFDNEPLEGWTFNGTGGTQTVADSRLTLTKNGTNAEYSAQREIDKNGVDGTYYMEINFQAMVTLSGFNIYLLNGSGETVIPVLIHSAGRNQKPGSGNDGRIIMNAYDTEKEADVELDLAEFTKDQEHVLGIKMDTQQKKYWAYLDGNLLCSAEGLSMPQQTPEKEYKISQVKFVLANNCKSGNKLALDTFCFEERTPTDEKLAEAKNALKISDLTQDDPSNLQHDLTLPATGQNETVITWLSNNQNLISDQGVLNQEEVAKLTKAVQVVMTATFSLGGKTAQQKYTFTIKPPAKPGDDEEKLIFHDTFEENDDGWVFTGGNSTKKVEGGKLTITSSGSSGFVASRTIEEKGGVGIFDLEAKLQSYTTTAEFWLNFYNANGDIVIRTRLHASGTSTPGSGNYTRLLVTGYNEENQKETEQLAGEFTKNAQHTVRFKIDTDLERIWTYIDGKQAGPADGFRFAGTGTATEFNIARFTVETGGCASGNYIAIDDLSCKKILTTINKLREAADAMLVSNLTDGDPSNLKQDLTLAEQGLYDTTVTWQSSQPQLIGNDGRLNLEEIANLQTSMPVDMTATFSLFGQSITKIYHFVLPANENEGWYTGVQEQFGTDVLNALWVRAAAENIIRLEQGTLLLRRVNTLPGMQAKRWLVEEGKAIGKTTVVEADITATAGAKMECLSLDEKTALRVLVRDGEQQPELVIQTGSAQDVAIPYTAGYTARIRALIDPQGGTVTVMVNGETVVNDAPLLETTHNLAAVSFSIPEESHGEMTIDNFSVFVRMEEAPQIILDSAGLETLFAGDYLYDNVILPQELLWNGKAVWKSSAPDIISDTGVISFTTEEQQAELTVHVYAGEDTQNYAEQVFPVRIAPYRGENLALGKAISSKASSASGKILTNLNDGDMDTMWMTAKYEENPSFTITLDSAAAEEDLDFVNTFMLLQANNAVKQYLIETSVDGTTWEEAVRSGTFGTVKTMPRQARYIRYTVLEKEQGNSGLIEFQVFFSPTDSQRAAADAKLLKLAAKSPISGNISLPEIGKYGSAITWESSRPDVVGNQGQFTNPQAQVQFVLTATVTSGTATVEKSFPFYTKAPSSGGTGGGGGGGRPASGGGSGTGVALPPVSGGQTTPTTFVYFKDVPQGHWAKDFIDALYEQKVISGYDGSFEPDNSVTREEFVKMIINALGIKPVPGTLPFKDVHNEDWFAPYVAAAVEHGIVSGISETEFGAGMEITREDMAVLCSRALKVAEVVLPDGMQLDMADADQIADYAQYAVKQLWQAGIINGDTDGNFRPKENLTRAEAAKVIYMIRNR